jgi:Rha family phage regulatory protein
MKELVYKSEKGTPVTTSLLVAQKFGKLHKDVLRAIDNVIAQTPENQSRRNFAPSEYIDESGKSNRMYIMTKDGFSAVVLGFTGEQAIRFRWEYIEAFNRMEKLLTSGISAALPNFNNPAEAARAWAQEYEQKQLARQNVQILEGQNELLTNEVKTLAPKAEYTDKILQSISTHTMTQVAKELGMSAIALERKLHEKGIIFKQSGQWLLYAKYQDKGYTKARTHQYTHSDGSTGTNTNTVWTEAGRMFVHKIMGKEAAA